MSVNTKNLRRVAGASAVVVTMPQAGTAALALSRGRRDYADRVWGPGLAAVAITSAAVGTGDPWRRWALAAATTGWAVRLEKLMLGRLLDTDEEDERYTEFLHGDPTAIVVAKVSGPKPWRSCSSPRRSSWQQPASCLAVHANGCSQPGLP